MRNFPWILMGALLVSCSPQSGYKSPAASKVVPPATQPSVEERHLIVALQQSYREVHGLSHPWPDRYRVANAVTELGGHTVTIKLPGVNTLMSHSRMTTVHQRDGKVSSVTILPLEEALPLDEIEVYLKTQLADWKLEPKESDSLSRMMQLVCEYVPKQGKPTISKLVIDGEEAEIDEEKTNKVGVPQLRGWMWLAQDILFEVNIRPVLLDKSVGYVSITFSYSSDDMDGNARKDRPRTQPTTSNRHINVTLLQSSGSLHARRR